MKKNVLVISNLEIFFIEDDIRIISEFAETVSWNTAVDGIFNLRLIKALKNCDFIYCWFASAHSLLPALLSRIFGKKLIVVSGGYDTADISDIRYGHAGHPVKKIVSRTILSLADRIIVNSRHSETVMLDFLPRVKSRLRVILHRIGYREPDELPERDEKLIITVMRMNRMNYIRKKMDLAKEVARQMPGYRFVHIGRILPDAEELFFKNLPENFSTAGHVPDKELWNWYFNASYLIAPSWHEGFGLTAVEALTAGCIPIISGSGAQNEVTLGLAHEIRSDQPEVWCREIRALEISGREREHRQKLVKEAYSKRERPDRIFELFSELDSDLKTH